MHQILIILIAAILAFSSSAYARLGETKTEIEARYGKSECQYCYTVVLTNSEKYVYESGGYRITVIFWDGISAEESFTRATYYGAQPPLTDVDITTLLDAYNDKTRLPVVSHWKQNRKHTPNAWKHNSGAYVAYYNDKTLCIKTTAYEKEYAKEWCRLYGAC